MRIGLLLSACTASIALLVTQTTGPVFGSWDWADFTLVLVLLELVVLAMLATLGADPGLTLRRWHFVEDPQAEFPLMGARPGQGLLRRIDPHWMLNALPLTLLACLLLLVEIVPMVS
jgi:hypothetical protein